MKANGGRTRSGSALLVLAIVLAGCASKMRAPAPVEDRSSGARSPGVVTAADPARSLPGSENAGKPGYYTVRQGDTLIRIALEQGQNWRDIVRWNALDNPNVIDAGQVLRVAPPASEVVVTRPVPAPTMPAASSASAAASAPVAASSAVAAANAPRPGVPAIVAIPAPAAVAPDDDIAWAWPAPGNASVLATFDEVKNKGMDIGGKAGDPVLAAADGRVVYAGAGLRGYGNLLILKHNNIYLTAYAHNQSLLVKEDQSVRKGQKIAEMGASDADRVKLHFEIRRQGKPVDPAKLLQASR
ncbi:MAG: peptidoglycan DD-metalloendopeptidase family protein [Ramlibacter sp.]